MSSLLYLVGPFVQLKISSFINKEGRMHIRRQPVFCHIHFPTKQHSGSCLVTVGTRTRGPCPTYSVWGQGWEALRSPAFIRVSPLGMLRGDFSFSQGGPSEKAIPARNRKVLLASVLLEKPVQTQRGISILWEAAF